MASFSRALRLSRVLAVAFLLLGSLLSVVPSASAQDSGLIDDNSYMLMCGCPLTWEAPWTVDPDLTGWDEASDADLISLENGQSSFTFMMVREADYTAEGLRDAGLATAIDDRGAVDLGTLDDSAGSHAIWREEGDDGETLGVYYRSTVWESNFLMAVRLTAPLADFEDSFGSIERSVDLVGLTPFEDVDADVVVSTVTDESASAAQPTDEPADEPAPRSTADEADLEEVGLTGRREYESPQYGHTVSWTRDWELDAFYEPPVISDTDTGEDWLYLIWTADEDVPAYFAVLGYEDTGSTPAETVENWVSDDFIAEQFVDYEAEVLLSDDSRRGGAVLYRLTETETDAELFTYYQITVSGDAVLITSFSAGAEDFEDALAAVNDDVEIDGSAPFDVLDSDDIADAIAA